MTVTFFGHRDTLNSISPKMESLLKFLIKNGASDFYVGNQGNFDVIARKSLQKLKILYPHIRYTTVLAYLPRVGADSSDLGETLFPEGMESVPPRFAIARRNRWMLENADAVIAYVTAPSGGAAKWMQLAEKQGKTVYNLAEIQTE